MDQQSQQSNSTHVECHNNSDQNKNTTQYKHTYDVIKPSTNAHQWKQKNQNTTYHIMQMISHSANMSYINLQCPEYVSSSSSQQHTPHHPQTPMKIKPSFHYDPHEKSNNVAFALTY